MGKEDHNRLDRSLRAIPHVIGTTPPLTVAPEIIARKITQMKHPIHQATPNCLVKIVVMDIHFHIIGVTIYCLLATVFYGGLLLA